MGIKKECLRLREKGRYIFFLIIFFINFKNFEYSRQRPNCVKNDPCDVIKMREMRGEVGKKPLKERWIIPHFYDVT